MLITNHAPQPQFTGWKDPKLTKQGEAEAKKGGEELKKFGYVSASAALEEDAVLETSG